MRLKLCIALCVWPILAFTQSLRIINVEVSSSRWKNNNNYVYLMTHDTVIRYASPFDGIADFYLDESIKEDETYVVVKQEGDIISRVRFDHLKKQKNVSLSDLSLTLKKDVMVSGTELDSVNKKLVHTAYEPSTKLWLDFSPEGQMRLYDTVRWFFPTGIMLNIDAQKVRIHNSYYLQNYYNEFGRYPTEQELDTLAKNMSISTAEDLIGWYSWHLLRIKEDELCNGALKDVYRFTMVSNSYFYTYEPYAIRIEPQGKGRWIMYCSYERYDECERKELYCDLVPLDEENLSIFLNIVKQMRFWEAKPTENPNDLYKTKKTNILEANIDGKYHVIFRGEGEDEGMEELREFLWGLTGLGENKIVHRRLRIE
ncbi:MAG: hypothetical protein IJ057_12430 [Bacteroidales bacterium]|nr:hypothetical protein [Bacteroidales bacterium]